MVGRRQGSARALAVIAVAGLLAAGCSSGGSGSSPKGGAGTSGDGTTTTTAKPDDSLKLNQIQVIGTHNSFHVAATGKEHQLLVDLNAEQAAQRTYSHPGLTTQLDDQKIRQIELDIFADAKGGLYASPSLRRQAGLPDYLDGSRPWRSPAPRSSTNKTSTTTRSARSSPTA